MNISQKRTELFESRLLNFSVDVINLAEACAQIKASRLISDQLVRSAMSIGANYAEANNASSKSDFRNKIFLAKKEAAETRYWLRLIKSLDVNTEVNNVLDECTQIIMILQKIISTMKNGQW